METFKNVWAGYAGPPFLPRATLSDAAQIPGPVQLMRTEYAFSSSTRPPRFLSIYSHCHSIESILLISQYTLHEENGYIVCREGFKSVPPWMGFGSSRSCRWRSFLCLCEFLSSSDTIEFVFMASAVISGDSEMVHARRLGPGSSSSTPFPDQRNFTRRQLLQDEEGGGESNRIGVSCSKDDISVYQGETGPLPNGIPTYTVQILNGCSRGCTMSDIHFSCGWFSSVRLINPRVFRRLGYDDCLVNDGGPLSAGGSLSFQYSNTFQYPLSVSYLRCH
ncbi:hypothetical protein H6P81_014832 [Aristolochia fimbriata]|uniref:Uncharacterized protein n=1 Tax=Aristolochia fimbriata TaxID=158543 RepID=A0AAV7E6Q7_ARIFI|nr:hypothetical protein H6P81_014832 [Aristolochia fimbriata]